MWNCLSVNKNTATTLWRLLPVWAPRWFECKDHELEHKDLVNDTQRQEQHDWWFLDFTIHFHCFTHCIPLKLGWFPHQQIREYKEKVNKARYCTMQSQLAGKRDKHSAIQSNTGWNTQTLLRKLYQESLHQWGNTDYNLIISSLYRRFNAPVISLLYKTKWNIAFNH